MLLSSQLLPHIDGEDSIIGTNIKDDGILRKVLHTLDGWRRREERGGREQGKRGDMLAEVMEVRRRGGEGAAAAVIVGE